MANPSLIQGDLSVQGNFSATGMVLPASSVSNSQVAATAAIDSSKINSQKTIANELFADASSITALTKNITTLLGATGTIKDFKAWITTAATGADRTVTVDLQKAASAGAFATICSATISLGFGTAVKTLYAATLSSTALVAGDMLRVVVTVAGAAGAQSLGLETILRYDETYA